MTKLLDSYIGGSAKVARGMIEANVKELLAEKNVDKVQKLLSAAKKKVLVDVLEKLNPNFSCKKKTKTAIRKEIFELLGRETA